MSRSYLWLASSVAGALLLSASATPSVAFADAQTTSQLTAGEMLAELQSVESATSAAVQQGWAETQTIAVNGGIESRKAVYAAQEGRSLITSDDSSMNSQLDVNHTGTYVSLSTVESRAPAGSFRRVLGVIGRPRAHWYYTPDTSTDAAAVLSKSDAGPNALVAGFQSGATFQITGMSTQTVSADGTKTYEIPVTATPGSAETGPGEATLTVDTEDLLATAVMNFSDDNDSSTYTYGVQHIALPSVHDTVTGAQLSTGTLLLAMPSQLRSIATQVVSDASTNAHNRFVRVATIRKDASSLARQSNQLFGMSLFSTDNIWRGVRVIATNPYTRASISYAITRSGGRATMHKD